MNGAEYIIEILRKKDTQYIFGLFGDIETKFAQAISNSSINWIGVHNEKTGGFIADIYSRVSNKPGIVFTTLGPGGTNLATALANATQDRSALIAISDQVDVKDCIIDTHQYIDFVKAFHPNTGITKYTALVKNINSLEHIFDKAFYLATTEPKGAVHISIPSSLFSQQLPITFQRRNKSYQIKYNNKSTLSYKNLLNTITSPKPGLVIVGGLIERTHSQKEFRDFVEKIGAPVLKTFRGINALPSSHSQCLGTISRHIQSSFIEIVKEVGYVLLVGYDYNEGVKPSLWEQRKDSVYNISSFDNRVGQVFNPPTLIHDIPQLFRKILHDIPASNKRPHFPFVKIDSNLKKQTKKALQVRNAALHPGHIIKAINKLYTNNTIIICDVGLNKYYSGLLLKSTSKNKIIFSNGLSTMAFSAGALGAKIADPTKDIIVLTGDGGFLMDLQEIITSLQYRQQIVWIVFNNGGLGLIEQAQMLDESVDEGFGTEFGKVNFQQLATAFGIAGKYVPKAKDVYPILKRVKESHQSAIIDVKVEYRNPSN
ncbi:MAG: thiamine pyrophosphate-binding protein [Microgenomates group bacterium]